jgi:hypothetical protein
MATYQHNCDWVDVTTEKTVSEVDVMSQQAKIASISVIGLVGLVVLLVGIFTDAYSFSVGLIIAIVCWVGSGILAKYWGIRKEKEKA